MDYQDNQGNTMAHWAVVQGRKDIFKLLTTKGADLNIQNRQGCTVLHTIIKTIADALMQEHLLLMSRLRWDKDSLFKQLLNLSASQRKLDFTKKDIKGNTALEVALAYNNKEIKHLSPETIELLEKATEEQTQRKRNARKKTQTNADALSGSQGHATPNKKRKFTKTKRAIRWA